MFDLDEYRFWSSNSSCKIVSLERTQRRGSDCKVRGFYFIDNN